MSKSATKTPPTETGPFLLLMVDGNGKPVKDIYFSKWVQHQTETTPIVTKRLRQSETSGTDLYFKPIPTRMVAFSKEMHDFLVELDKRLAEVDHSGSPTINAAHAAARTLLWSMGTPPTKI